MMLSRISDKMTSLWWGAVKLATPRRRVRARGLNFSLTCDNAITHYRWRTFNDKEPETLDWIDRSLTPADTLFDVGANIGIYSIYAALRHPGLRVVCFEPEFSNLHLLRDNVIANGLKDRIEIYGIGLSAQSGLSGLYVQDLTPGAALHSESRSPMEWTNNGKQVVCREGIWAMRLDDFVAATGRQPNAIKIDVDGTEADILHGAAVTLSNGALRSVLVELDPTKSTDSQAREMLSHAGFSNVFQKNVLHCQVEIWDRENVPGRV